MRPARLCVRKNWKRFSLLRGAAPATPGGRSILGEYGAHMGSGFQQKIFHMGSKIGNSGRYTRGRPVNPHLYYTTLGRTCQVVILHKKKRGSKPLFLVIIVAVCVILFPIVFTGGRPWAIGVKMTAGIIFILILPPVATIVTASHFHFPDLPISSSIH